MWLLHEYSMELISMYEILPKTPFSKKVKNGCQVIKKCTYCFFFHSLPKTKYIYNNEPKSSTEMAYKKLACQCFFTIAFVHVL